MNIYERKKEELLNLLLKFLVIFGAIAYVPSLVVCVSEELYLLAVIDTAAYVVLILIFFLPQSNYRLRLYAAVFTTLLLGTAVLYTTGTEGAGHLWLLCAVFISALFGRLKIIVITVVLSQVGMLSYGALAVITESLVYPAAFPGIVAISANLLLISITLALITYNLLKVLQREIDTKNRTLELLNHRVKNSLQSVESIVALERYKVGGLDDLLRRIQAVSAANELLLEEPGKESVNIAELFRILVDPGLCKIYEYSIKEIRPEKLTEVAIGLSDLIDIIRKAAPLTIEIDETILISSASSLPSMSIIRKRVSEFFFPSEWLELEGKEERVVPPGNPIRLKIPFYIAQ